MNAKTCTYSPLLFAVNRLSTYLLIGFFYSFPFFGFSQNTQPIKYPSKERVYIEIKNQPFYSQYNITSFGSGYGLNSTDISALFQDKNGFIWVGNKPGVSRFDGHRFQNFTKAENGFLGLVHTIAEDGEGTLWVGGENGFFFFQDNKFYPAPFEIKTIRTLHLGEKGELWVGGFGFVPFALSPSDLDKIKNKEKISSAPIVSKKEWAEKIGVLKTWAIDTDKNGVAWLGLEHGYASFDGKQLKAHWMDPTVSYGFSAIAAVDADSVFLGSEKTGIVFSKGGANNNQLSELTGSLCYMFEKTDTSIYFFTTYEILELNKGLWKSLHRLKKYRHVYLKQMILDKEGNFWLGAEGNLLKYSPTYFKTWTIADNDLLESNFSIAQLPTGEILIGSTKEKILKFEDNNFIRHNNITVPRTSITRDIYASENGWVWYATSMAGIILDKYGQHKNYGLKEGLGNKVLYFFYKSKKGILWSGGEEGITAINIGNNEELIFENYLSDQSKASPPIFYSIFESPNGNIWAASDKGLFTIEKNELIQWSFPAPISKTPILTSSAIDKKGQLWLGTQGEGLWQCAFNPQQEPVLIRQWTKNEGLLSNVVLNIHVDKMNRVWAVSQDGICCLDFKQDEPTVKCYDQSNGWSGESTSHYDLLESRDSLLWAVGVISVTVFPLYDLPENKIKPNVFVQRVQLFDGREDIFKYSENKKGNGQLPEQLKLPHDKNFIRFHLTSTSYANPEKNKFKYKLEGLDHDWNTGLERNILYPGLQPGNYSFIIMAANNDGIFNDEPAVFNFKILNPWYRTWWAITIGAMMFFGVLFYWYHFQLDKKSAQQEANRLKELDKFKTRFYANITHEFRTPLTVISGMADELKNHPKNEPVKKINLIKKNSENLLSLVNQMLDLSKLQAGKAERKLQQSDIIVFLKYLTEAHESFAKLKNIALQFYSEEKELLMDFSAKDMEQVLTNIISNAVKFTPEYGNILVVAKKYILAGQLFLEIRIKDNGIGISKEQLPHIFDRFHQANPAHENQGSGIGLALVKELVGVMDGKINVESEPEKGTVFYLHFPIKNNAPAVAIDVSKIIVGKTLNPADVGAVVLKDNNLERHAALNGELPILLIIEDNADVVYYLKTCLVGSYQIYNSRNGKTGIEKAQEILPDIIISDVMMPEMDGFEVCKIIKTDERTDHIPIILLTAKATSEDKLLGLQYGADAYLTKPFEKEELLMRLEKLREVRKKLHLKYSSGLISQNTERELLKTKEETFIEKLESIILKNINDEGFSIHDLSRELLLSRSQMHRKIKALTGMSTAIYIRHVRLQKAKGLLVTTDFSISEIAYQVGFKTPVYFSQVFKEEFGVSPSGTRGISPSSRDSHP